MAMTPREARTVTFNEDRRGYAQTEVHEYQERVAEALRMYETEVARLKARLEDQDRRIGELQDAEEAVRRTFVAASQTKREMVAEAEEEAARVRREADGAAARLRATTEQETSQQRAAAQTEATRLVGQARREADELRGKAEQEVRLLERRLLQLRTSITDLEERLREFAGRALDELAVAGGMIDLETADLTDIEALQPETAPVVEATETGDEEASASDEAPTEVTVVAVETEVTAVTLETAAEESDADQAAAVPADVPAPAPTVAAAVEPATPPGPAVGIPVRPGSQPAPPPFEDDGGDGSFYERRLAGLRRRIESASED